MSKTLLLLLGACLCAMPFAQTKPVKKPQTKPKPTVQRPTMGTAQMPGDNGKLGIAYTMGAPDDALNFTLDSAEFAMRASMLEDTILPKEGQKLLILTFTVHNPQKRDMSLSYNSFALTAVAPDDANHEFNEWIYHPERKSRFDTTLKPAQKVKAIAAFPIHGKGPVNKLIVKRGDGMPVLRYDLRGKVKALSGIYAAGETDARVEGEPKVGEVAPLGFWDVAVEGVEKVSGKIGDNEPNEDESFFLVTMSVKNPNLQARDLSYNSFNFRMLDTNGEEIEYANDVFRMSTPKTVEQNVKPGESVRVRVLFRGASSVTPARFFAGYEEGEIVQKIAVKFGG